MFRIYNRNKQRYLTPRELENFVISSSGVLFRYSEILGDLNKVAKDKLNNFCVEKKMITHVDGKKRYPLFDADIVLVAGVGHCVVKYLEHDCKWILEHEIKGVEYEYREVIEDIIAVTGTLHASSASEQIKEEELQCQEN